MGAERARAPCTSCPATAKDPYPGYRSHRSRNGRATRANPAETPILSQRSRLPRRAVSPDCVASYLVLSPLQGINCCCSPESFCPAVQPQSPPDGCGAAGDSLPSELMDGAHAGEVASPASCGGHGQSPVSAHPCSRARGARVARRLLALASLVATGGLSRAGAAGPV